MASAGKKIIAVVGATGLQGSSVAHTFLSLPNWHVRCLTRSPSSSASEALRAKGAEIVQADLADGASLSRAFQGANAIFLNTNFFDTFRGNLAAGSDADTSAKIAFNTEVFHGKNAVIAAAAVPTLERFVYSTFVSMSDASEGKWDCLHWKGKSIIVQYTEREQLELAEKTSLLYPGAYNTNPLVIPQRIEAPGEYSLVLPVAEETRIPMFNPQETTGPLVHALVEKEAPGVKLLGCDTDSYLTVAELAAMWRRVTGKDISIRKITVEELQKKTGAHMEVLGAIPFLAEYGYTAGVDVVEARDLESQVKTKTYEQWLEGNWEKLLKNV